MAQRFGTFILAVWLSAMLAGCGGIAPSGQPALTPGGMVVTVRVADAEEYRLRLTDLNDIGIAHKLLAGESAPRIPNGRVVRGEPDVNVGYSWHIDPDSVEFTDTATEVCDGRPSDVEKRVITSDRYCPWSAKLVAMTPDVLLGLLGEEVLQQRGIDWHTQPLSPRPIASCLWLQQTQHNVCDQTPGSGFKRYWQTHDLEFDG